MRSDRIALVLVLVIVLVVLFYPWSGTPVRAFSLLNLLRDEGVILIAVGYAVGRGIVAICKWLFARIIAPLP